MKRSCQRHTQVLDLPVSAMIAEVPRPSPLSNMMRARQTCFCGLLGFDDDRLQSLTIAERYGEGDTVAHAPELHATTQNPVNEYVASRRIRWRPEFGDQPQEIGKQHPRHGYLSHLEDNIAAMADDLGSNLDQFLPQRGQRPVLNFLRQGQRAHEVAQIVRQCVKLKPNLVVAVLVA